jgi:hypothetical protein
MPPAPQPAASGNGPSRPPFAQLPWLEVAGFAALLAAIVVPLLVFSGPSSSPSGSETAPSVSFPLPSRAPFQFESATVRISSLGKVRAFTASRAAGEAIRAQLSRFYDQGFVDPATWSRGIPVSAWGVFSSAVRAQAQKDAPSLALGNQLPGLTNLLIGDTSLSVRVLVDGRGRIQISAADVLFAATGYLRDGRIEDISSQASFLFRPESGRWMIVGYPRATIDLTPTPLPSPGTLSPTPAASGASP